MKTMMSTLTILVLAVLGNFVRGEGSQPGDGHAAQPSMEVPLKMPELISSGANVYAKNVRSGYSSMQQNYGSNDYGMSSYESSQQNYGFNCYGKPPALYGDANYDCRIFHVCQADGRQDTLRCPKQTRFNNYLGVCDWENKIDQSCMPLYKEEYSNNYGSQGYDQGSYSQQGMNYRRGNQY